MMSTPELLVLAAYLGILGLLSWFGLHRLFILWLYRRHRDHSPALTQNTDLPFITVQLPVFNERHVLRRLIDAVCRLDWPRDRFEVQVLDDSTDDSVQVAREAVARWRERGVSITHLRRARRVGYKAGALHAGMTSARGQFIAIFDADFIPQPGFLRDTMPAFTDERVGMVQTRWGHVNEADTLLTRLSAVLLDAHFVLEHTARNRSGRFMHFNGTAGVWRRRCILDAGGWQHDTLTEDLDLSYRAQLRGWRFVFLRDVVVPAELPDTMRAFKAQQHRWAKGTTQCARKLLPRVWRSDQPWWVKAEAVAHLTANLTHPLALLMALLLPVTMVIRARAARLDLVWLDLPAFLLATASVALFYLSAQREVTGRWGRGWHRIPLVMALGIGITVNQSRAVFEGLFGRDLTFVRTPKSGGRAHGRYRLPAGWTPALECALSLLQVGAILWAVRHGQLASVPFLMIFAWGFGYVGLRSLHDPPRAQRRRRGRGVEVDQVNRVDEQVHIG